MTGTGEMLLKTEGQGPFRSEVELKTSEVELGGTSISSISQCRFGVVSESENLSMYAYIHT